MLFNSLVYFIFFPVVVALYFLSPQKYRGLILLTASITFYMWFVPVYILILAVTITIDYFAAIWMEKSEGKKKRYLLIVSIVSMCSVLFTFKYFNFFNGNLIALADFLHWNYSIGALKIILPIGLSFHTFQSLSYAIEVYRGKQKAEHHFGTFALYVMFFPQLVAGPIERPQNLLHQFYRRHIFKYERVASGLRKIIWGLFKKIVIADNLALLVNMVYGQPQEYSGFVLLLGTVFFAFQIYCDFSGYSDIAIGSAQVLGFRLMTNFNRPYFAISISDFWKRWHISLSTWFRDYVYIPLGGSRVLKTRLYFNLIIVFVVSGFWHGANWTYIVWGGLNGLYFIISLLTAGIRKNFVNLIGLAKYPKIHRFIQIGIIFILVDFSWIFFRAQSIQEAFYIITKISADIASAFAVLLTAGLSAVGLFFVQQVDGIGMFKFTAFWIVLLLLAELLQGNKNISKFIVERPIWIRWLFYYGLIMCIFFCGVFGYNEFIYFQF